MVVKPPAVCEPYQSEGKKMEATTKDKQFECPTKCDEIIRECIINQEDALMCTRQFNRCISECVRL